MLRAYFFLLFLVCSLGLLAQPGNDECGTATALPDEVGYCSGSGAFTNAGATTSLTQEEYAVCLDERTEIKDVWFSFRAQRNSVSITVTGAVASSPRGTLQQPQFSLVGGGCTVLENLACRSPFVANGSVQNGGNLIFNELQRGEVYYILVGARSGNEGTFGLCVEQFDAVPDPSSDCPTAVILCDKSSFAVQALAGLGMMEEDLLTTDADCSGSPPREVNSSWYKWTCDKAGSLSFDITPLGAAPNEDIDFMVYELTNGLEDCGGRQPIRQMFSGESGRGAADLVCLGKTGLQSGARDTRESCGCQDGDNNYISAIDMEAGKSYALMIMNFTGSGDGFTIDFGGTGTFLGPEPNLVYSTTEACVGQSVTFEDRSTSLDGIAAWAWDFGATATPRTATGAGPHTVSFREAGSPAVTLAITTTRKCVEYISSSEVNVICCGDQFSVDERIGPVSCPEATDGSIDLTASSNVAGTTLSYTWSTGQTTPSLSGLDRGTYAISLTDGTGCTYVDSFLVDGPEPFVFDTLIVQPDCAGGTNGVLELKTLAGGAGGYEYSFENGPFQPSGRLENLPITTVNVVTRDANGCTFPHAILVDERQLGLVAGTTGFHEPTCNGGTDGRLEIEIANGIPGFRYDFGSGFQAQPRNLGLPAGAYFISAVDSEGCTGEFDIVITEPPLLELSMQSDSSSCFQADDGSIFATAAGGRPGYRFDWADGITGTDRLNLPGGTYVLNLTDSLGCVTIDSVTLNDPDEVVATVAARENLICFNDPRGAITLNVTGGSPDYAYSLDGINYQTDPRLDSLLAGDYDLYVRDQNGCLDSLSTFLTEPDEFIIDVVTGVRILLGRDTTLNARSNYGPLTYTWGPDSVTCLTGNCSLVRVLPLRSEDYFVAATNAAGCVDTARVAFLVIEDLPVYIPNVISPNNDGNNDVLTVFGGPALATVDLLRIYNRWGGLIYESTSPYPANEPTLGWDGTLEGEPVNSGVYVFYTEVSYINGRVEGYRGDVTVVR